MDSVPWKYLADDILSGCPADAFVALEYLTHLSSVGSMVRRRVNVVYEEAQAEELADLSRLQVACQCGCELNTGNITHISLSKTGLQSHEWVKPSCGAA